MTTKTLTSGRSKQGYYIEEEIDGKVKRVRVPGTTTICGSISGQHKVDALIQWGVNLHAEGKDWKHEREWAAGIGTLTHDMILAYLKNEQVDTSNYTPEQIDKAENAFLSYLEYERQHTIEPILVEEPLVSVEYRYGGTPDLYALIDGVRCLKDFKTGNYLSDEITIQLGGYDHLLIENGYEPPEEHGILQIPKAATERYFELSIPPEDIKAGFSILQSAIHIYRERKAINKLYRDVFGGRNK